MIDIIVGKFNQKIISVAVTFVLVGRKSGNFTSCSAVLQKQNPSFSFCHTKTHTYKQNKKDSDLNSFNIIANKVTAVNFYG